MRGPIRSSHRRFADYVQRRRTAGQMERVAERRHARDDAVAAPRRRGAFTLIWRFLGLLGRDRLALTKALCCLAAATGLGLALPYATKITIDYILAPAGPAAWPGWVPFHNAGAETGLGPRTAALLSLGGVLLAAGLLAALIGLWGRWMATQITRRLQVRLRRHAFEHAVRLPITRVSDLKAGGVASILREDAGNAAELVFSMIYNPARAVIQLAGALAFLAWIDWRMLLGALGLLPIVWLTHRTWIARLRPIWRDIRRTRQSIDAAAAESFSGIRVVRGFHRGEAEAGRFSRDVHFMARQEILAWWWGRVIETAWQILVPMATVAVLMYGGYRVLQGALTIGDLTAFTAYILMLLGPIEALVGAAANMQSHLAGFDRTLDLFAEEQEFQRSGEKAERGRGRAREEVDEAPEPIPVSRDWVRGRVAFEGVTFRYPRSRPLRPVERTPGERLEEDPAARAERLDQTDPLPPVLSEIDLVAEPGQTIALVGPSGSGKSTLTNLVARFYDPTLGRVTLDGRDLRELELDGYRRLLGVVEQEVFLFDGTVAENIAYARRNTTEDDIVAAAKTANAHGFITDLEDGYGTLIGERGVRLSGGQKQRLAIARAVLADPLILILDEATSNLDSESERLIQASLAQLMQGRTSFVIAHRLSTIRHADLIVVLENGRVRESGAHDELMALDARYAELVRLQTESPARVPTPAQRA